MTRGADDRNRETGRRQLGISTYRTEDDRCRTESRSRTGTSLYEQGDRQRDENGELDRRSSPNSTSRLHFLAPRRRLTVYNTN